MYGQAIGRLSRLTEIEEETLLWCVLVVVVAPAVTRFEAAFVCLCFGRLGRGGRSCGCNGREARLVAEGLLLRLL